MKEDPHLVGTCVFYHAWSPDKGDNDEKEECGLAEVWDITSSEVGVTSDHLPSHDFRICLGGGLAEHKIDLQGFCQNKAPYAASIWLKQKVGGGCPHNFFFLTEFFVHRGKSWPQLTEINTITMVQVAKHFLLFSHSCT